MVLASVLVAPVSEMRFCANVAKRLFSVEGILIVTDGQGTAKGKTKY